MDAEEFNPREQIVLSAIVSVAVAVLIFGGVMLYDFVLAPRLGAPALLAVADRYYSPPVDNAPEQYYRGVYDICMYQISDSDRCLQVARGVAGRKWYEQPSSGWEWGE